MEPLKVENLIKDIEVKTNKKSNTPGKLISFKELTILPGPGIKLQKEKKEINCCMTVYNEPAMAILVSLYSLLKNIGFLVDNFEKTFGKKFTVFAIIDGFNKVSSSTSTLLADLGLNMSGLSDEKADIFLINKVFDLTQLQDFILRFSQNGNDESVLWLDLLNESKKFETPQEQSLEINTSLEVVFCIKKENKGKLNSHWVFFDILCDFYDSKYCIQMDAGSIPKPDAIYHLYKFFEKKERAGAAASMVLINNNPNYNDIFHIWQTGDFIYQRLFCWPSETLIGYLTTIPGQFCFIRTAALLGDKKHPTALNKTSSPVENYFRGLKPLDPFQESMFLAEDRIIGFEIICCQENDWNLYFVPSAVSFTDPCISLKELLQQRRRWCNSSFTCNVWFISQMRKIIKNRKRLIHKLLLGINVPAFFLNELFIFLIPAISFMFPIIFKTSFIDNLENPALKQSIYYLYVAMLLLFIMQIIAFLVKKSKNIGIILFKINTIFLTLMFVTILAFTLSNGLILGNSILFSIVIFAEVMAGFLLALLSSKALFINYLKVFLPYFIIKPIMMLQVRTYSFCNFKDTSWGTKGLISGVAKKLKNKEDKVFYRRFIMGWLTANIAFLTAFLILGQEKQLLFFNIFLSLVAIFTVLKVVAGFKLFTGKLFGMKENNF